MTGAVVDRCVECGAGRASHVTDGVPYCRICCRSCAAKWADYFAKFPFAGSSHLEVLDSGFARGDRYHRGQLRSGSGWVRPVASWPGPLTHQMKRPWCPRFAGRDTKGNNERKHR